VALLVTIGIAYDRWYSPPLAASLVLGFVGLVAWLLTMNREPRTMALIYLGIAGAALAAAYHHYRRSPGDLTAWVSAEDFIQLRGYLDNEPVTHPPQVDPALVVLPRQESTTLFVQATAVHAHGRWQPISERLQVYSGGDAGELQLHVGDLVEIGGRLHAIQGPRNPGEPDMQSFFLDQGIGYRVVVRPGGQAIARLERQWPSTLQGWLAWVRNWSQKQLAAVQSNATLHGLTVALVLGDGSRLPAEEWSHFQRTGVIQVLVVSGQHLVLLTWFVLWLLPRLRVPQHHQAWLATLFLLLYVLMTGGHPPGIRSAVTMGAIFLAWIPRRRTMPANLLALAWLVVAALNPMDLFSPGCQLSFLCVLVLHRLGLLLEMQNPPVQTLDNQDPDALRRLVDEARPSWLQFLLWLGGKIKFAYVVALLIWLAGAPVVAYYYHTLPLIALLLTPPLTVLTSVALFLGFLLLLMAVLHLPGTGLIALGINASLGACDGLVRLTEGWPFAYVYVPSSPEWWISVYLVGLLAFLTIRGLMHYWATALLAATAWLLLGLLVPMLQVPSDELRCTFLAIGHGGCTVIETPDGRTIVYDVGSLGGPYLATHQVAPFLWHRGIRRIDELILSHADLDHFNGVVDLAERFAIGQVTTTPTFADKHTAGVLHTLELLRQRQVPIRIVKAGDVLQTNSGATLEVLHPPAQGPPGNENARSLTLRVRYHSSTILLTGDLEGEGLEQVLHLPPHPVDVLMAPHHGSRRLDADGLVAWCRPRLIVSCQGPLRPGQPPAAYVAGGRQFWTTEEQGAITIRIHSSGVVAETFVTGHQEVLSGK
jgi:competence protein ComEC